VSIFGTILAKIFPSSHPAVVAAATSNAPAEATEPTPEIAADRQSMSMRSSPRCRQTSRSNSTGAHRLST
jgi:hypothetical protein